jgi:hypothetical protein
MAVDLSPAPSPPRPSSGSPRSWNPAVVVGAVVVVALVGGAGWLLFREDAPSEPGITSSTCGTVVSPPAGVDTTTTVLVIGDSIMAQPSCALAPALAGVGVESHLHAVGGSGLLTGNWPKLLSRLLDSVHPDVVIATFVGNYNGPPVTGDNGKPIAIDMPAFFAAWQEQAQVMSDLVRISGADLYWVQPPPIESSPRAARLFAGYQQLGDQTLSSGAVVAGADGGFVNTNACAGGAPLRMDDGLHYSDAGAQVAGQQIAHDLAAALGLPAVPAPC